MRGNSRLPLRVDFMAHRHLGDGRLNFICCVQNRSSHDPPPRNLHIKFSIIIVVYGDTGGVQHGWVRPRNLLTKSLSSKQLRTRKDDVSPLIRHGTGKNGVGTLIHRSQLRQRGRERRASQLGTRSGFASCGRSRRRSRALRSTSPTSSRAGVVQVCRNWKAIPLSRCV